MGVLNLFNFLLEVKAPKGLWASIINWLEGGIGNYAVVIIVLTIMIKLVMLPFDLLNKSLNSRNSAKQVAMKPELDKINKRYANNKQLLNQKTMELYKREHFNLYGTCAGMLVYLILTFVIFMTLFGALRTMSSYKIQEEFKQLQTTYTTVYTDASNSFVGDEAKKDAYCTDVAEKAVVKKYGEIKTGFLWIKSIWRADNWSSVVLDYNSYISQTKTDKDTLSKADYDKIMTPIHKEYNGWNGYLILAVLTVLAQIGTTYLNRLVSRLRLKKKGIPYVKGINDPSQSLNIIMPLIMGIFTLFYTASFGIYILAGAVFTMITTPLTTLIVDSINDKKEAKNKNNNKVSYSR